MKRMLLVLTAVVLMSQALAAPAPSQSCGEVICRRQCGCGPGCVPDCISVITCECQCLCK